VNELPPLPPPDRPPPAIPIVLILVALMLAGGAVVLGDYAVKQKYALVRRGWELKPVMVAVRELPAGTVLRREDLTPRDVPEQLVTASLFTDARALEGKTLFLPIFPGTPLHASFLAGPRACTGAPP
jgi:Flp pilus assembly protein CpaB